MEIVIAGKRCRVNNLRAFDKLKVFLISHPIPDQASESDVRKELLVFVENILSANEWVLYDGNTVWNVKRLIKQFKTFIRHYDYEHFTDYLYKFFSLQCGSIAHYNKEGWLSTYPTLEDLKEFFKGNEYGNVVADYPPAWHYDARRAAGQMSTLLLGMGTHSYPRY
jgi:hypothetical protein